MAYADLKQLKLRMTKADHSKLKKLAKKRGTSMVAIMTDAVKREFKLEKA